LVISSSCRQEGLKGGWVWVPTRCCELAAPASGNAKAVGRTRVSRRRARRTARQRRLLESCCWHGRRSRQWRSGGIDCAERLPSPEHVAWRDRRSLDGVAYQRALALGTATRVLPGPFAESIQQRALNRWLDVWRSQELSAACQVCGDVAACQESVMANTDEPLGQYVQQEASDKLVGAQPHDLGTMVVGIILPVERDLAILQREQAGIGNSHAVGIAAEIAKHLLGP